MERHDRPAVATFYADSSLSAGASVSLGEAPAHHARVKRLKVGNAVRLTNGAGAIARGSIAKLGRDALEVVVEHAEHVPPLPGVHLRVPIADRERMLWLAEKATELGVTTWQAVRFRRSASVSPRGEGAAFEAKVRARMVGALEQSGGAWMPRILPETDADSIVVEPNTLPIVLDVSGTPLVSVVRASEERQPVLLFGPEGGIEPGELAMLTSAGWHPARVASATLRFETAGITAIAVCRNFQLVTET